MLRSLSLFIVVPFFLLTGIPQGVSQSEEPFEEKKEKQVKYEQLPKDVKKNFQDSEHQGKERKEVEKIMTSKKGVLYEIEVMEGKEVRELYYDPDGKMVHSAVEKEDDGKEKEEKGEEKEEKEEEDKG